MKWILLGVLFLVGSPAWALDIPQEHRVSNRSPGYCCWACLETVGNCHNISALRDLVERRSKEPDVFVWNGYAWIRCHRNRGYMWAVREKLNSLGVAYRSQSSGNFNRKLLRQADDFGCVVGMRAGAFGEPHAILLTHYSDTEIKFYDTNHPRKIFVATREWFDYYWDGMAIVIKPQEDETVSKKL